MQDASVMAWPADCASLSDEGALIRAAQEDPLAFDALYHRYVDRIYAYLRARTRTLEDATDLTQQVFLQALQALPSYCVSQTPFVAWLFRIARNLATNHQTRSHPTVSWARLPESLHPAAPHDPETTALGREATARVGLLFRDLDANTRELLMLRFAGQLTTAEIAAVIGKSEATTRKMLSRTMQRLKEQYNAHV